MASGDAIIQKYDEDPISSSTSTYEEFSGHTVLHIGIYENTLFTYNAGAGQLDHLLSTFL